MNSSNLPEGASESLDSWRKELNNILRDFCLDSGQSIRALMGNPPVIHSDIKRKIVTIIFH